MKLFISISIFLLSLSVAFSQDYNKKNRYGQKTGEWIEFYPEGFIKQIRHFTPLDFKPDTFMLSIANSESKDTIISANTDYVKATNGFMSTGASMDDLSVSDWSKTFEYDSNWQLIRVIKRDTSRIPTYLYGAEQQIGIVNQTFQMEGVVGSNYQITIPVENFSDRSVRLQFENLPNSIDASQVYNVPSNAEYDILLNVTPEPDYHIQKIELVGEKIKIKLTVNIEGYHYITSDFRASTPVTVTNRNLIIKRINSEALLTILSPVNKEVIKQIPLSRELAKVSLTDFTPGEYIFVFTDYSNDSKIIKKIELK